MDDTSFHEIPSDLSLFDDMAKSCRSRIPQQQQQRQQQQQQLPLERVRSTYPNTASHPLHAKNTKTRN